MTSLPDDGAKGRGISRRDFTAFAGLAILAQMSPTLRAALSAAAPSLDGRDDYTVTLVGDRTETLASGAIRRTLDVEVGGLPPDGRTSHITVVQTRAITATGDVIAYSVPHMLRAVTSRHGIDLMNELHLTCRFQHGAVTGNVRQDTLTITGRVGGNAIGPIVKRVSRPIMPGGEFNTLTPTERLVKARELVHGHGGRMPGDHPGAIKSLD